MRKAGTVQLAFIVVIFTAMISLSCRNGNENKDPKAVSGLQISNEHNFVRQAIANHQAALELLDEALMHAASEQLKREAQVMKDDHKRMVEDLQAYSRKMKYSVPPESLASISNWKQTLSLHSTGPEWDQAWMRLMTEQDQKMVQAIHTDSALIKDPPLITLVNAGILVMKNHIDMLVRLPGNM